ncbi:hypothetical protein [Clostridium sp. BJN0001]|uniref:hypothetical protein n=1 Tax=Clostridium sp. BJN0001 TaxID=2930219 RepID=UPI001FD583C2|nr:hypothetical protein [Clostridium sp. BJN0001]
MANQICKDTGCCQANCSSPLFKDNSQPECCTVTSPVTCSSITNAVCTPILTERILNCMTFEKIESAFYTPVAFTVDAPPAGVTYTDGAPVCITKIGISYSAIGIDDGNNPLEVYANGAVLPLTAVDPSFVCGAITLYNNFTGTLATDRCCYGDDDLNGVSYRIIQSQITFTICTLEVLVKGKIGCEDFTGSFSFASPIDASGLGISDFTFSGALCLPRDTTLTIYDQFTPCLDVFSVTSDGTFDDATDTFPASIELGLKVNKKMFFTNREELAVFVPQSSQLNCVQGTDNIPQCPTDDCNI